jgi:prepilin signal peptidase PulO-like enzyme (type II secretory pathway)
LFIACVLALPSALFKYCRESYHSKDEVRDNSFPFIPYLTLAFFIVRYSQF